MLVSWLVLNLVVLMVDLLVLLQAGWKVAKWVERLVGWMVVSSDGSLVD